MLRNTVARWLKENNPTTCADGLDLKLPRKTILEEEESGHDERSRLPENIEVRAIVISKSSCSPKKSCKCSASSNGYNEGRDARLQSNIDDIDPGAVCKVKVNYFYQRLQTQQSRRL